MTDSTHDNDERKENRTINTGGGSYIEGTSKVDGGDFVGRDRSDRRAAPGFRRP